jgi:hypothetical protein
MADYIRPTPRNPILGLLADAMMGGLSYMEDPRRTQQMRGVGGLLSDTGLAQTVERLAYGEPLTKGTGFATRMKPETANAVMALAPEAVPIGRAAMAGVRATKGLPVGAGIVYHGSPYRFNRFDPTKIGSGEGAQAYGYGHYVAESPQVAKGYQSATSKDKFITSSGFFDPSQLEHLNVRAAARRGDIDSAIEMARKYGVPDADYPETAAKAARDLARLEPIKASGGIRQNTGNLYTIDLPDPAIARMLDWDRSLSEQAPDVQKIIGDELKRIGGSAHTGERAYKELMFQARMAGKENPSQAMRGNLEAIEASNRLRELGIPGIRYLDQGSRGTGVGTSNFVVFPGEEELLRILSVNGGLLSP